MKPNTIASPFVHHLLVVIAATLAGLAFCFTNKTLTITEASFGTLTHEHITVGMQLGQITVSAIGHFLAFLAVYLIFEFYGFKPALYSTLTVGVAMWLIWGGLALFEDYVFNPYDIPEDEALLKVFALSQMQTALLTAAWLGAGALSLVVACGVRRLTRGYFMFLRFPAGAVLGWALYALVATYAQYFETLAPASILVYSLPVVVQFVVMVVLAVVPLYVLRLVLGLFRGKAVVVLPVEESEEGAQAVFAAPVQEEESHKTYNETGESHATDQA